MKLNREAFAVFIDTSFNKKVSDASKATFEIVGDGIEDMSIEMNPDTEQTKDILGQTKTKDNGYEPSMDADPFYADTDSKLYEKLRDIAMKRLKGDECKTLMLEVIVEDTEETTQKAYVREVIVKPNSYGGDTSGFQIPFNVSEDGEFVEGTVTTASIKAKNPVFTSTEQSLSD